MSRESDIIDKLKSEREKELVRWQEAAREAADAIRTFLSGTHYDCPCEMCEAVRRIRKLDGIK